MKCPKCGYLGFERVDRCRNCGYDFALISTDQVLELPLRRDSAPQQPLDDLAFLDAAMASESVTATRPTTARRTSGLPTPADPELPLFGSPIPDDLPLITRPSPPRSPLAVRRSTPEVQRVRNMQPRPATLELELEPSSSTRDDLANRVKGESGSRSAGSGDDASIGARLAAVVADLLILATIDVGVIYFTMQICGIGIAELSLLPRVPLFVFLLIQNGGYLIAFTAGGQTLGKMAAGVRVIADDPSATLDLGRACVRQLVWLVLAVPVGLGLLSVLRRDHRGIHDRFAGTRVVRV